VTRLEPGMLVQVREVATKVGEWAGYNIRATQTGGWLWVVEGKIRGEDVWRFRSLASGESARFYPHEVITQEEGADQ
jgi:hypothetical protein